MSTEPRDENVAPVSDAPAAPSTPQVPAAPQVPAPEVTAASDAPATPAPDPRPKPAYGEYAPEGWSWTPPENDAPAPAAAAGNAAPPAAAAPASGKGVTGVPHNLGARGSQAQAAAPNAGRSPAPQAPPASENGKHYQSAMPTGAPTAPQRGGADRIISILLLVVGAFGAFNLGVSVLSLPETFTLFANAAELESFVVPEALRTTGTISAVVILAIYAVNLILTIQRVRAGKLAFWVPLVAGAIAFIVLVVATFIGLMLSPELVEFGSDPDAMNRLMEQLTNTTTP